MFPLRWSNSVCSHPLFSKVEREVKDNVGVKAAAIRRLEFEFGIIHDKMGRENFAKFRILLGSKLISCFSCCIVCYMYLDVRGDGCKYYFAVEYMRSIVIKI